MDISGVPKARPLDGLVRALVELKPNGNHRAELVLFALLDLGLVFQVGLARTKRDRDFSEADLLPRSDASLLLAMRANSERRRDAFGWRSETDQEPQPKDARTWNEAAGEQLRPYDCHKETADFLVPSRSKRIAP